MSDDETREATAHIMKGVSDATSAGHTIARGAAKEAWASASAKAALDDAIRQLRIARMLLGD